MTSGVLITLIIVAGFVLIALAGIAWLWWATARGDLKGDPGRMAALEREVRDLRRDVDDLRHA